MSVNPVCVVVVAVCFESVKESTQSIYLSNLRSPDYLMQRAIRYLTTTSNAWTTPRPSQSPAQPPIWTNKQKTQKPLFRLAFQYSIKMPKNMLLILSIVSNIWTYIWKEIIQGGLDKSCPGWLHLLQWCASKHNILYQCSRLPSVRNLHSPFARSGMWPYISLFCVRVVLVERHTWSGCDRCGRGRHKGMSRNPQIVRNIFWGHLQQFSFVLSHI